MSDPDTSQTLRSFIAINPDASLRAQLAAAQAALRLGPGVRWTPTNQIHLTLKFLGEIPVQAAPELAAALQRGCGNLKPFTLRFDGLGCFPNFKKPRVIWIKLDGEIDALQELQRRVEYETITLCGADSAEDKKFVPHLTLGRVKEVSMRERQRIGAQLQSAHIELNGEWRVQQISLMKSELTPKGAIHSELAAIDLKG